MTIQRHSMNSFLKLTPAYRDYVWGGEKLRPGHYPTAEAWVVWEEDIVESGPFAGRILGDVASEFGEALLGTKTIARTGTRFPVLIKLLDCAQWLSLQVHPNDEQAVELQGEGQFGKTEAWHILESESDAKLIAGLKQGTTPEVLAGSIRNGTIIDHVHYMNAQKGETVFMPAGTLHALGPGLLIYEVQQTSDWTYRVYDWGRPASEKRPLHIDKSIRVTRADFTAPVTPMPKTGNGTQHTLVKCDYFTLELLSTQTNAIELDTNGETFHAITVIEGAAVLESETDSVELAKFQTAVVPSEMRRYRFQPQSDCRALLSSA